MKNSFNLKDVIYTILAIAMLWSSISTTIQAFKCPEMTQTELLIGLPKSFIANWKSC